MIDFFKCNIYIYLKTVVVLTKFKLNDKKNLYSIYCRFNARNRIYFDWPFVQ